MSTGSGEIFAKSMTLPFGINLVGYIESEKGVGEALRAALRSIQAAGLPYVVNNFPDTASLNWDARFAISENNPYSTNLVYLAPEHVPQLLAQKSGYFSNHFNIGGWTWELTSIPDEWREAFGFFHEIWVPSSFVRETMARVSPIPVVTIPHAIDPEGVALSKWNRERLGLPPEKFIFLFVFDFHSTLERKNPLGLIQAFRKAFGDRTDVLLLIKCSHASSVPDEFTRLKEASGAANVKLMHAVMPREALRGLMAACDCYVSLHRSEGFGLTMAEAMALGRPAIATGYSGNLDFMNAANSFLVRYRLKEIAQDHGPYRKGNLWAEPDLDHAAELLQHVCQDWEAAAAIAAQGRRDVFRRLHPRVVGALIRDRLLAATQEELVRRSQEWQTVQEQFEERGQELRAAQEQLEQRSSELNDTALQLARIQKELAALDARLQEEQAAHAALEREFQQLRYRMADRINALLKKNLRLHRFAKSVVVGFLQWRHRRKERTFSGPLKPTGVAPGAFGKQLLPRTGALSGSERPPHPPRKYAPEPAPPIPAQTAEFAACTIIANNYFAQARVLADSFRKYNPGCPFFVLVMGRVGGYFDPGQEKFLVLETDSLDIADRNSFFFKYNLLEASTAIKPYFLEHLLRRHNLRKLVYLDPDILITDTFTPLCSLLDRYSVVLTPHLTSPISDSYHPGEFQILQAGAYNLGFIALRNSQITDRVLSWWKQKVYHHCLMAPERGMHVDQKWMDLAPVLFSDVLVLREPGYNVAYWNLHERTVTVQNDSVMVNGTPCYFFHFSGIDLEDIEAVSRHQNRFRLSALGEARLLFEQYRELVLAAGWNEAKSWPYCYDYFENGARIPELARRLYWSIGEASSRFANPFDAQAPGSFFRWLNEPVQPEKDPSRAITRLWYEFYKHRADLRAAYPDVLGAHREGFLHRIHEKSWGECGIDPCFLPGAQPPGDSSRVGRPEESPRDKSAPFGVNVVGYVASEKGMGEAVRADIRSLQAVGVPHVVNDFTDSFAANLEKFDVPFSSEAAYGINLFHVNADQAPILARVKKEQFAGRYNIGYWTWELSCFPREWRGNFRYFDEIWVPSDFAKDAISSAAPIPVIRMPYSINPEMKLGSEWTRARFALDPHSYVFLFLFDFYSVMERKNPLGLVRTFRQAFGDRRDVVLFIKCSHSEWAKDEMKLLRGACQAANITLHDAILTREAVNALIAASDCYVSLHRSEGFGLTMAEAMALGKPVVATGYSGNTDFMRDDNSFLVRYRLAKLKRDYGPYPKGAVWAEPDIDHAAELMRFVYENRTAASAVAQKGCQDVLTQLHPATLGSLMRERLLSVQPPELVRTA